MRPRHCVRSDDRGSGTVLLLALMAAVLVVAALLGLLATAQLARGRAQSAADLGALAGAAALRHGTGEACAVAGEVVRRNGARLSDCADDGSGVVRVRVVVRAGVGDATAAARAGPSSARGRSVA